MDGNCPTRSRGVPFIASWRRFREGRDVRDYGDVEFVEKMFGGRRASNSCVVQTTKNTKATLGASSGDGLCPTNTT